MEYKFYELSITSLVELIDNGKIDLNPSYQRNFIWSPINQRELIDTIILEYPLPNFFLYKTDKGTYEMVDGQQRTKTIFRFIKGLITASDKFGSISFNQSEKNKILNYKLAIIEITKLMFGDSLKDFYVRINKGGVHLNTPEVNKSEFFDTNFLRLANEVLTYQNFINLNIFTEALSKRMNDRAFVEELLAFLEIGINDKKKSVEELYRKDISGKDYERLKNEFYKIIDTIETLNKIYPISKTRYKQKNDFYTLFTFIAKNEGYDQDILQYQYKILLLLDGKENDGNQFIRPSNDKSVFLREYAINCVTQSNSKTARDFRLNFFNSILKNQHPEPNQILADVLNYLGDIFGEHTIKLKRIGDFYLLDVDTINNPNL